MTTASAPGKIILLGEHAVVYNQPALAVPVRKVQATATIQSHADPTHQDILIEAANLGTVGWLRGAKPEDPLARITTLAMSELDRSLTTPLRLVVKSTIPIAAGLGSGAAVSVAIGRAIGRHFGQPFTPQELSEMAFEVEKIHHGTPSGIDNTVIAFDQPVYYLKGSPPERLEIDDSFSLIIADSGIESSTVAAVGRVRQNWQSSPDRFEEQFDQIGSLTRSGREAIERGDRQELGRLMNANHELLNNIGVGLPKLDNLVSAARTAGALGSKLSGAGMGGNCIALVEDDTAAAVDLAMRSAGAVWSTQTEVET